ncbi:hypothetical protein AADZ90_007200 [Aestuariibius sp. 2305UL40-4]|uniref:hypothetical protein n=1 Tax=Aestuariibius violaceus TaxID=3234132 RepID=UPI00345E42E4
MLDFIAPPKALNPTLNAPEIQRELRAIVRVLEASEDRTDRLAARAIRRELDKMSILERQLCSVLKV